MVIFGAAVLLAACGAPPAPTASESSTFAGQAAPAATPSTSSSLSAPTVTSTASGVTTSSATATANQSSGSLATPRPTSAAADTLSAAIPAASPTAVAAPLVVSEQQMANPSLRPVAVAGHTVNLPPGFTIAVFASGLSAPRFMAFDWASNLAVAEDGANRVVLFPQQNGRLSPQATPLITGLDDPTSVAFYQGFLYVAEAGQVSRYPYRGDAVGARQVVVPNLPAAIDHHTRTIVFGPDGALYLGIGAPCNVCVITDPRYAAISRYNADGSGYAPFARGLRNPVGLAFQPGTNLLWATVNGRDNLGDNVPWDLLAAIRPGADYGFPGCYDNRQPDPQFGKAAGCVGMALPEVGLQAHSAPLGLAFYTGNQFPAEYRGDLFVALHGSWNRSAPTGYDVVRAHFANGRVASVTAFATGWAPPTGGPIIQTPHGLGTAGAWGRPVQPVVAPDGSLYLSDDYLGAIYCIAYTG